MDNELIYHKAHDVLINHNVVVIGKNSYQLNNITSTECLMEKGIHRKILGIRILWLMFIVWIPFILTLIVAILVNEKAMMGSLNFGVLGLILSFGLLVESFSEKCWLVINDDKVMAFKNKEYADILSQKIKSAKAHASEDNH